MINDKLSIRYDKRKKQLGKQPNESGLGLTNNKLEDENKASS